MLGKIGWIFCEELAVALLRLVVASWIRFWNLFSMEDARSELSVEMHNSREEAV